MNYDNDDKLKNMSLYSYKMDNKLCTVAENFCNDLCSNGTNGNIGSDGSTLTERLKKENIKLDEYSESILYGYNNPIEIVNNLIIDRYSKNEKNKKNIFNPNFTKVGIALMNHIAYRFCCVIIYGK